MATRYGGSQTDQPGFSREIEVETKRIMNKLRVDTIEFSEEVQSDLRLYPLPWVIPKEEIRDRMDLRQMCIFTIDRQFTLDPHEAISCKPLGNGMHEIGFHVTDVSYFVTEDSKLDKEAAKRANCVYLIGNQIPMLPQILREDLCSLNPGIPRLALSVIWKLSEKGEIIDERFGRTIVRSCCKFTFDDVHSVINEPDKEEFPPITDGVNVNDIKQAVLSLYKIAKNLRQRRVDNGALYWHSVRLQDVLDPETGTPTGNAVSQPSDVKYMIEEFILLANMAVAKKITGAFPRQAIVHRLPYPPRSMFAGIENVCRWKGIQMDTRSSGAICDSLVRFSKSELYSDAWYQVLCGLVSRCMQRAQYVCTAINDDEAFYHHYSLNVPIYTHFTAPFRSYPNIMVQRILSAAIEESVAPSMSVEEMQRRAKHCNEKMTASRRVTDQVNRLHLAKFIRDKMGIEEEAIVSGVFNDSFFILILKFGVSSLVHCKDVSLKVKKFCKEDGVPILTVIMRGETHEIAIFTRVKARLQTTTESLQWYVEAINF